MSHAVYTVAVSLQGPAVEALEAIAPAPQWDAWMGQWLRHLDVSHSPIHAYQLSLHLTDDAGIQRLNRDYRDQDRPTDVLAFAALEGAALLPPELLATEPVDLGDVIVSLETAQRQSADHQHTWQEEVLWLVAHGVLHLLGWDHPDEVQLQRMWQQQRRLLAAIGVELSASAYVQEAHLQEADVSARTVQ